MQLDTTPPPTRKEPTATIPPLAPLALKRCGCGRVHYEASWLALSLVGQWELAEEGEPTELFELRNCACKSTIAVPITVDADGTIWRWEAK